MLTPSVDGLDLPFNEAIDYFRDKVNLPTDKWDDLMGGMHSRAFVIAGATESDLLSDLRMAVDRAISDGTTLEEFRKDFDSLVDRHGWKHKGNRGWRTAVIYNTNLSVAYSAGRYAKMTDPDVLAAMPYWRYMPSGSADPRPEHMAWYNVVLPADDPWWETHYAPNDYGCKCGVMALTEYSRDRLIEAEEDGPFPVRTEAPDDEFYEWTDRQTGEVHQQPKGIGPGWDYNPGQAAWGRKISEKAMNQWRAQKGDAWERLTPGSWESEGLPRRLTPDKAEASVGPRLSNSAEIETALRGILGKEEKIYHADLRGFQNPVLVNAKTLSMHLDPDRSPFLPLLPEAIENPHEVWISFERHKGTGKVVLRQRFIKAIRTARDKVMLTVTEARGGVMEAWTMIPGSPGNYMNLQRQGRLLYAR
ncbi:PBECR2 nuclease fold domain-containing protein [uncultured Pseudodesulfovibrio sp.]|uniref:PBECR2 nuclease fold domain-containing protein n=1 Tax=uncultured Pseudodesulfovibrio sp. TaxID=2035858 RepID=UPI0029C75958|nr:PBECR2 nuclease fold domain-containing protein [uncultured Pseudodesulfovibrio sp.]